MIAKLLMAITMALSALGTPVTGDVFQAGDHYLMIDEGVLTLWAEANGFAGLQPTPVLVLGQVLVAADHQMQL